MTWALTLFGRAPVPGRAKTRLIPALGPGGAATLYAAFVQDCLAHAQQTKGPALCFSSADNLETNPFSALTGGFSRESQAPGGLGERILQGLARGLSRRRCCVIAGTDAPTLPASYLQAGQEALQDADVVLGPCADGGYYLIGARRISPAMFEGVRFSTRHALRDTRQACERVGLRVALLATWYDVDRPEDLVLLRHHLQLAPEAAPATARWLAQQNPTGTPWR